MNNKLDSLFDQYYKEHHFSGVALIKGSERVIFERAYGFAHRGFKVPNSISTMFQILLFSLSFETFQARTVF